MKKAGAAFVSFTLTWVITALSFVTKDGFIYGKYLVLGRISVLKQNFQHVRPT